MYNIEKLGGTDCWHKGDPPWAGSTVKLKGSIKLERDQR